MKNIAIAAVALLSGCVDICNNPASTEKRDFGTTKFGEKASLYTLEGRDGLKIEVSDFGGRLVRCWAPDRKGALADVTLGWNSVAEYERFGFSMGTLIGRYGNRIRDGRFTLDGKEVVLPVNETTPSPRHCNLHGGPDGWDSKVWNVDSLSKDRIVLSLVSPDGDMGFPGTVKAKVTYSVLPGNVWRIEYEAETDKPTVLNLTHHSYWNLAGEASGDVLGQLLGINADKYTRTDAGLIPTQDAPVAGTGMDFRSLRPIGAKADLMAAEKAFAPMDNWYDHNFVLNGKTGDMKLAAEMVDPVSGRSLEIWTTEPCMQMYGAQNMTDDKKLPSKTAGVGYRRFQGMALETQHYPDSPNRPDFPTTVLRPGEKFKSVTEYRFGAR